MECDSHAECVRALTRGGADPASAPEGQATPLDLAIRQGYLPVIEAIMDQHLRPNGPAMKILTDRPCFMKVVQEQSFPGSVNNTVGEDTFHVTQKWRRCDYQSFSESTPPIYLGIVVPDEFLTVQRLVFRTESCDQGKQLPE